MPEDKAPNLDGAPLSFEVPKRGPGRPAGSKTKSAPTATQVSADVRAAKATLESMYKIVGLGLMTFGLTRSAEEWMEQTTTLSAANEDALKASPKLAKWLANAGSTGGATTLIVMHGMAIANVAGIAREELAERRPAQPRAQEPVQGATVSDFTTGEPYRDPTLIPGT